MAPELVLVTPTNGSCEECVSHLHKILAECAISAVIVGPSQWTKNDIKLIVETVQSHDVAAILCDDTQALGQTSADGLLITLEPENFAEALRLQPRHMVGGMPQLTRHHAMEMGEKQPDFLLFGDLHKSDDEQELHQLKELALWWADLFTVPGIAFVTEQETMKVMAQKDVEFFAVRNLVWQGEKDPLTIVTQIIEELKGFWQEEE